MQENLHIRFLEGILIYWIRSIFSKKNLQNTIKKNNKTLKQTFIWNATITNSFDSINYKWLLKHLPISSRYRHILKKWLLVGLINNQLYKDNKNIIQKVIMSVASLLYSKIPTIFKYFYIFFLKEIHSILFTNKKQLLKRVLIVNWEDLLNFKNIWRTIIITVRITKWYKFLNRTSGK